MPNYTTNLKTWGDTGAEHPDNYSYVEGEQPVDDWDNFFNSNVINDIEHLISVTNSPITVNANDGLDGGGDVELTESVGLSINVSDFAGSGIQDNGSNDLELVNDTFSISAGDGLNGSGTDGLGGSLSLSVDVSDFAGAGIVADVNNNLQHQNTSSQGDVTTGGATVIDDIGLDTYGHVDNINTENRRLDDWLAPTSTVYFDRDGIQSNDDWLEIDGNGSGVLLNYKNQSEETRVYGSFEARSSADFQGSVSGIALGDLDNVTATGEGSGGGFNADMVDGQDADSIAPSFAAENGSGSSSGINTISVSFTNTYDPSSFVPSVSGRIGREGDTDKWGGLEITSLNTDGSGNITGMDISGLIDSGVDWGYSWYIMGETV
jgi:hypothetical protein